ncbi:MAG: sodium:solute symporter family protein [Bacteroidota bacterium]
MIATLLAGAGLFLAVWLTDLYWPGLLVVLVFYLLIFGVGVWAGKREGEQQTDNFLLAGRKLPLWIAVLTMAATWIGGGYINGTAEYAASQGLVWVQAPWGYALSLIIGGLFFARKMRRFRFRTMLDPLSQRYGHRATGFFFLPAVMGEIFWIAAILTALGTTFAIILGLSTEVSIITSAAVAIIYTMVGGLRSVAYTDVVQLIMLGIGLFVVAPVALMSVGGIAPLWEAYEALHGSAASPFPDYASMGNAYWNWWDYALLLIFGGIPWQVYFQRVLAAKDEKTAMWLSIAAGFICILIAIPAAMIGMIGGVTDWGAMGLEGPENAASMLPYVFQHLTTPLLALLGLATLAAAVMSSIDSFYEFGQVLILYVWLDQRAIDIPDR